MKSKTLITEIKNGELKERESVNVKHELTRTFGTVDLWNRQRKQRTSSEMRRHLL